MFSFFTWLDHLPLISAEQRREWCPSEGQRLVEGQSQEVFLEQGRHRLKLAFTTRVMLENERIEDVFSTWPFQGALRILTFTEGNDHTVVTEVYVWKPPFFLKQLVDRRVSAQENVFLEKLSNAKRLIETAYNASGEHAFAGGVLESAKVVSWPMV